MIEIKNVSFTYDQAETPSLQNINISIKDGECILFCGKSGCGKTTMLRLLNGMIPDFNEGTLTGTIRINKIDPVNCQMHEISKTVGTVFQNPRTQFYTVNTSSEIAFGCENYGMPPREIRKRVIKVAKDLKIESLLDRNIFELSGGEKQKIAFASIYALNPDVYVLDEPSSNLDFIAIRELQMILSLLKKQGKTIVLAEHRTWYLKGLVDRAFYLENGSIIREYSMQQLADLTIEERKKTGIRPVNLRNFHMSEKILIPSKQKLTLCNIQFQYRKEKVLEINHLEFNAGKVVAVVGKNGAGKSTLISIICGLIKNKSLIKRKHEKLFWNQTKMTIKKRLAASYVVMQEVNHQLFTDSVEEEIVLGVKQPSSERLSQTLCQMDIAEIRERHPMTLSGGQKQRVAIGAAVFCEKHILAFDEPTSGLDFTHMMQTADLLKSLKRSDRYIFVITHDYEFVLSACDEILEIESGHIKDKYLLDQAGKERLQSFFQIK